MAELAEAVGGLPERLAIVVSLYYTDELTFREIGEVIGVTESRACQLHGEAVRALRAAMGDLCDRLQDISAREASLNDRLLTVLTGLGPGPGWRQAGCQAFWLGDD
jgi:hypothetical protein